MDRSNLSALWKEIDKIYPGFAKKQFEIEAQDVWLNKLEGMTYKQAIDILDKHLKSDKGDRPPTLSSFYREVSNRADAFLDMTPRKYHVGKGGELLDEEGREYGGTYSDGSPYRYYTNKLGYICRKDEYGNEVRIA